MIDSIFHEYGATLATPNRQEGLVKQRVDHVIKALKKTGLQIDGAHLIGSYARDTIVAPLAANNVDLLIELNPTKYNRWQNPEATHHVMRVFYETLVHAFPKMVIDKTAHEVTLQFPEFRFDVIPALPWQDGGTYLIPDVYQEKWLYTSPRAFADRLAGLNRRQNGMLLPLIKLIKAWNRNEGIPLRGFHIECMVMRRYEGTGRLGVSQQSLPVAVCDFFLALPAMLEQPCVDPILSQRVDAYLGEGHRRLQRNLALDKANDAADYAAAAYEFLVQGKDVEALSRWAAMFGKAFLLPSQA